MDILKGSQFSLFMASKLVFITERGQERRREAIVKEIERQLRASQIPLGAIEISIDPARELGSPGVDLVLYLAGNDKNLAYAWSDALLPWPFEILEQLRVIPIVSDRQGFMQAVPNDLNNLNGIEMKTKAQRMTLVALVLRQLGLAEEERRVFISYKREDSQDIALQIWEELGKRGYRAFLDQFSIDAGIDFQRRIAEELADMAFVVLLETAGIKDSKWVNQEIALARKYRLGLMVLGWPDLHYRLKIQGAFEASRLNLGQFGISPFVHQNGKTLLKPAVLEQIVQGIEDKHRDVMLKRRQRIIRQISREVRGLGHPHVWQGRHCVQVNATEKHLFGAAARNPDIMDLYRLYLQNPEADAFHMVHPSPEMPEPRAQLLEWVALQYKMSICAEDGISQLVSTI